MNDVLLERNNLRNAVVGISCSVMLSVIFFVVYSFTSTDPVLKNSLDFSMNNLPQSLFTSLFVHNNDTHISDNSFFMLTLGTLFFYYRGARRGCVYFLIFGIVGHLLEIIFALPVNLILRFYMEGIKKQDLSNIGFWLFPPSGAGVSGSLMGMFAVDSYELFQRLKQSITEFRKKNGSNSRLDFLTLHNMIVCVIPFLFPVLPMLERILADLGKLFEILWLYHFTHLEPDIVTTLTSILAGIFPGSSGNPFLAHAFGMVAGVVVILLEINKERPKSFLKP